jgi:hypothetical protein
MNSVEQGEGLSDDFKKLICRHGLVSAAKQEQFQNVSEGKAWSVSMLPSSPHYGKLGFDATHYYRMQVLGTVSMDQGTWLWSWANPSMPEDLTRAARSLRDSFPTIPEFQQPGLYLSMASSHAIGHIATGVCKAKGYFVGPRGATLIFLLIRDESLKFAPIVDPPRLIRCVIHFQEIGWARVSFEMLSEFMRHIANAVEVNANESDQRLQQVAPSHTMQILKLPDESKIFAHFNEDGNIAKLTALLGAGLMPSSNDKL